jgi:hypothetical protein
LTDGGTVRVGCGSGYADDLLELAVDMVERGNVDYLCMDALAERTLALAQLRRLEDPDAGYDTRLEAMADELLPAAAARHVTIITNSGQANPRGAGHLLASRAKRKGLEARVAIITGDDVRDAVEARDPIIEQTGRPLSELAGRMVSANAYTGCERIVEALAKGATVVIGGRLADPSPYVGALAHHFGWALDDWHHLGAATLVGHLLECGTHVTGGNFADPPYRIVPSFARPSHPYANVDAAGNAVIHKLPDTDGLLTVETCKVQLGYEIHDPARYLTPDVTADFSHATLREAGDGIAAAGATGTSRPEQLKVLVGVEEGFVGEGQVSFAGPGALERAKLAQAIVEERVAAIRKLHEIDEIRYDLLGVNALHGPDISPTPETEPYEVHFRMAVRTPSRVAAALIAHAVEYTQVFGPAGTAGHRRSVKPQLTMFTCFLPREAVPECLEVIEA